MCAARYLFLCHNSTFRRRCRTSFRFVTHAENHTFISCDMSPRFCMSHVKKLLTTFCTWVAHYPFGARGKPEIPAVLRCGLAARLMVCPRQSCRAHPQAAYFQCRWAGMFLSLVRFLSSSNMHRTSTAWPIG